MSEEKYSQLKRIEHSLNNYTLSIQNNLKKLGCDEKEERFHFLYQKVSQANLSKKIKFEEDQKDKFRQLFENMWINEVFVQDSINQQEPKHQYFYFVYIAFYYSLFTSLSIVVRLFEPNINREVHKRKIEVFNKKIVAENKFLKECYFNPFSLVRGCPTITKQPTDIISCTDIKSSSSFPTPLHFIARANTNCKSTS